MIKTAVEVCSLKTQSNVVQPKLLVVGDVMLDRYIVGNVDRISPEAPVPVVKVIKEEYRLGGAGNVALNIANLGETPMLFGYKGNDFNGEILINMIKDIKIFDSLLSTNLPTICKTRVIGNHQQIVRYDFEEPGFNIDCSNIIEDLLRNNNFVFSIISDYGKGVCSDNACQMLIQSIQKSGGKVIVDPKGNAWGKYTGSYLVKPNLKELSEICGTSIPNKDLEIEEYGFNVLNKYKIENLLITRSEKGMSLVNKDQVIHFPTQAKSVYDVTGAGDTVIATLVVSLFKGLSLQQSVMRANYAASLAVSKFGTYAVSLEELSQWDKQNLQ